jgi:hypothetical protein
MDLQRHAAIGVHRGVALSPVDLLSGIEVVHPNALARKRSSIRHLLRWRGRSNHLCSRIYWRAAGKVRNALFKESLHSFDVVGGQGSLTLKVTFEIELTVEIILGGRCEGKLE